MEIVETLSTLSSVLLSRMLMALWFLLHIFFAPRLPCMVFVLMSPTFSSDFTYKDALEYGIFSFSAISPTL